MNSSLWSGEVVMSRKQRTMQSEKLCGDTGDTVAT